MDSADRADTCRSCGAPRATLAGPCPYCGHPAPQPPPAPRGGRASSARSAPARPGVAVRRRGLAPVVWLVLIVVVIAGLVPCVVGFVAVRGALSAVAAIPQSVDLTPGAPDPQAAVRIALVDAYIRAGERNDPDAAYGLFLQGLGADQTRADVAAYLSAHAAEFAGYQAAREDALLIVHGTSGDSWLCRGTATFAGQPPRTFDAEMVQRSDTWKLLNFEFTQAP